MEANKCLTRAFAAFCISVLASAPAAAEDMTVVSKIVSPVNGTLTLHLSSHEVRYTAGARDWIYSETNGKFVAIDHAAKKYYEWTAEERETLHHLQQEKKERDERHRAEVAKLWKEQSEAMGNDKTMADVRSLVEKADAVSAHFGAIIGPTTVQTGGATRLFAKHECDLLVVKNNLQKIEVWSARDLRSSVFTAFEAALLEDASLGVVDGLDGREISEAKDNGLPLKRTILLKGDADAGAGNQDLWTPVGWSSDEAAFQSLAWEVVRIDKGPIDPSVFAFVMPDSYQRVVSPIASRIMTTELVRELDSIFMGPGASGALDGPGGTPLDAPEVERRVRRTIELSDLVTKDGDAVIGGRGRSFGVVNDSKR